MNDQSDLRWVYFMAKAKPKKERRGRKRKPRKDRLTLLNIKVSRKDRALLLALARRFEQGNLSAWLRRAGLNYKPMPAR